MAARHVVLAGRKLIVHVYAVGGSCHQQGQPLPGQVAAGGDVTRCRSGQAEPAVDGTCVRKGVTGGARAPRALSLWNALVRGGSSGGSSGILVGYPAQVGYPAHTGRRGTPARRRGPSAD
ncbi:hypothetical protein TIFTF001_054698 [Ficus carica]|uniref:Uncharacterized protein n=1 Tax=Ficus carica TaxID=3494 RepID=A0AA88ECI4_FICCA|nr:hypothetical protein TIFTF001_054698 [Ficus carica]